jgi:hypothetical protein
MANTEADAVKLQLASLPSRPQVEKELAFNREMLSEFLVATMRC